MTQEQKTAIESSIITAVLNIFANSSGINATESKIIVDLLNSLCWITNSQLSESEE